MEMLKKHIKENLAVYFIVVLCFLIGVSVGAFTVKAVDPHQKQELVSYLKGFFQLFNEDQLEPMGIFRESIKNNTQLIVFNWILGLVVIAAPVVLVVIGFKGFVIGFTVGLLLEEFKVFGVLLFLLGVLPHNIIIIPTFIFGAVLSVTFAMMVLKAKINKVRNFSYGKQMMIYSGIHMGILMVLLVASTLESFVIPFFIKVVVRFMG